jgi:hypothetical protein
MKRSNERQCRVGYSICGYCGSQPSRLPFSEAKKRKALAKFVRHKIECTVLSQLQGDEMRLVRLYLVGLAMLLLCLPAWSQQPSAKRKIIIDQDASGPGGSDQQAILSLVQSPQTEVLGITVVTGDAWLKEEVAHALRTLEIIGRTDIPVVAGAGYPLVRRKEETELWEQEYGSIPWQGAWTPQRYHPADQLGEMPEGKPTTKPADEDAVHFLMRMVRKYPHEITIYEGAPMTNLALAISIDPEFVSLAKELVFMGGSASPKTNDLNS